MTSGQAKVIAHDLGTGGNKASVYDVNGHCLATSFVPYETSYPETGKHEQCPDDWWSAVVQSTRALLRDSREPLDRGTTSQVVVDPNDIACIVLSGHSLGAVPIDRAGRLLREATPIWSDTRAHQQTRAFFEHQDGDEWYLNTGNGFPAECYTVFKVMWYRDNEPDMFSRIWKVLGTKDYINYRLTGEIATDYSYASGSGVYDLRKWEYNGEFIRRSGLDRDLFPDIVPSTASVGCLTPAASHELGLPETVEVIAGGVDNSCMALGAGNTAEGRVYTSLGSSSWIAVSSAERLLDARARPFVFAHVMPGLFTSAVSIFAAGSAFKWIRNLLFDPEADHGQDVYQTMNRMAERSPVGARRLLFNPSLAGGANQEPNRHIRGALAGIDLLHTRNDVVRAAMEGIAMNLGAVLEVLRERTPTEETMLVVGGGSRSRVWRQILADVFGMRVRKTQVDQDAGSLGAAALGLVGCRLWDGFELIDKVHRQEESVEPIPSNQTKYRSLMSAFNELRESQAKLGKRLEQLEL